MGVKCPSVLLVEIFHSEGPFEVAIWEAMIVLTPKCPSEVDFSHWETEWIFKKKRKNLLIADRTLQLVLK